MQENTFFKYSFSKRLKSMVKVDFRRMFTMPLYYIVLGVSLVIPILVLVMTTLMAGQETTDPNGNVVVMEQMFTNVWQIIASVPKPATEMTMDITTMCNIDMMYFAVAVLMCLFVSSDFRSGYAKCLFTVRSNKIDYIISKSLVGFATGTTILLSFLVGALIGGSISNLSFGLVDVNIMNLVMCLLSKICLVAVFVSIFLVMSLVGKQRTWLSMILSFGVSMLLFMMVSSISPLNSTIINLVLSLVGGILFSVGIGFISNLILKKTSLV